MKTPILFILFVLSGVLFASTNCKAQGSGSAYSQHLLDSLKITDADEIAVCNLVDDAVTESLTVWKAYCTNGAKPTQAQTDEVRKKFQQKLKELQPQIDSFKKKASGNYAQAMNFAQYCSIETMRIYSSIMPGMGMRPGYPMPGGYPTPGAPGYPTPPANPNH